MIEKLRKQNGETSEDLLRLLERMQAELDVVRAAEYIRKLENAQMEALLRRYKSYIKDLEAAIRTVRSAIEVVTRAR